MCLFARSFVIVTTSWCQWATCSVVCNVRSAHLFRHFPQNFWFTNSLGACKEVVQYHNLQLCTSGLLQHTMKIKSKIFTLSPDIGCDTLSVIGTFLQPRGHQGVLTWHGSNAVYLIIPELSDFLVLHSRVIPDEVGSLVIITGLAEVHLIDDYSNWGEKTLIRLYLINTIKQRKHFNKLYTLMEKRRLIITDGLTDIYRTHNKNMWSRPINQKLLLYRSAFHSNIFLCLNFVLHTLREKWIRRL